MHVNHTLDGSNRVGNDTGTSGGKGVAMAPAEANGWVTIPGGPFLMGCDATLPNGTPTSSAPAHVVHVDPFTIAVAPVSVREFERFVAATGHVTTAERVGSSWTWQGDPTVPEPGQDHLWFDTKGACWTRPRGPGSDVDDKADHPVTHVSQA